MARSSAAIPASSTRFAGPPPNPAPINPKLAGKAQNWEEFRSILKKVWGPGQNASTADVEGNIGYVMAARVPIRKKSPRRSSLAGETDDYEWTGYIPSINSRKH